MFLLYTVAKHQWYPQGRSSAESDICKRQPRVDAYKRVTTPRTNIPPRFDAYKRVTTTRTNFPPRFDAYKRVTTPRTNFPPRFDAYKRVTTPNTNFPPRFAPYKRVTTSRTNFPPRFYLSLIHISEPTRLGMISYAVFCLKKKTKHHKRHDTGHHKQNWHK